MTDTWLKSMFGAPCLPERFWAKVISEPNGCWLWVAATNHKGYGIFGVNGSSRLAHRVAFEALSDRVPDGLFLDHLCRVRKCVNPDHLEIVSRRENTLRGTSVSAIYALRTECSRGHEYTSENTYLTAQGVRRCRECKRIWHRMSYRRKMAAPEPCPICGKAIAAQNMETHIRRQHRGMSWHA